MPSYALDYPYPHYTHPHYVDGRVAAAVMWRRAHQRTDVERGTDVIRAKRRSIEFVSRRARARRLWLFWPCGHVSLHDRPRSTSKRKARACARVHMLTCVCMCAQM